MILDIVSPILVGAFLVFTTFTTDSLSVLFENFSFKVSEHDWRLLSWFMSNDISTMGDAVVILQFLRHVLVLLTQGVPKVINFTFSSVPVSC